MDSISLGIFLHGRTYVIRIDKPYWDYPDITELNEEWSGHAECLSLVVPACLQAKGQNASAEVLQGAALLDCKKRGEHHHFRLHSLHSQSATEYTYSSTDVPIVRVRTFTAVG